ncbi:hypothetical protein QTG56_25960 (plasmid) [Rossellomorea sp. AcN35-11]|nr:hypothetical protein [Rossellomorea aquimaris]WJV32063.1 hypothetical protein QTG56_25960 [Rossellomorea sp. AcN35-11]
MTKYDKAHLIKIAKRFNKHFSSVAVWNEFAKMYGLPKAASFAYHFGGWNKFKEEVFGGEHPLKEAFTPTHSLEELRDIGVMNKEWFTKINVWNEYAKERDLPSASVYIHVYGTWNDAKKSILGEGVDLYHIRDGLKLYRLPGGRMVGLSTVASEYPNKFTSVNVWNAFAKENELPSSKVFERAYGSWNAAKKEIFDASDDLYNKPKSLPLSELVEIAIKNQKHFSTKKNWDLFAMKYQLPRAETFANRFGTWSEAKKKIFT